MRLLRQVLAIACVAVLLYQEPVMRSRKAKVVPLHLALGGALHWAHGYDAPRLQDSINVTSRSLLTPLEYLKAPPSKRTLGAAYSKTARKLVRLLEVNSTVQKLAQQPSPNLPLIGANMVTLGSATAVILPGAEFAILAGCGCFLFGCPGMTSQPELFFVVLLAIAGLAALRSSRVREQRTTTAKKPPRQRTTHAFPSCRRRRIPSRSRS